MCGLYSRENAIDSNPMLLIVFLIIYWSKGIIVILKRALRVNQYVYRD